MTTMHRDDNQDQPISHLPILDHTFDDFLAQAEHELVCRRQEVRALRRRARRQRRREVSLRMRTVRFVITTASVGLAIAGTVAFIASILFMMSGDLDAAKGPLALSAAAWGAARAIAALRPHS